MQTSHSQDIWIVGCGDIGLRVVQLYKEQQINCHAVVRSDAAVNRCNKQGLMAHQIDLDQSLCFAQDILAGALVYYFSPPVPKGQKDTRLRQFFDYLDGAPRRVVLISTTGVYGDCDGAWIDESTPVNPKANRAYRRLDAEMGLLDYADHNQMDVCILRVPGIYAKDRLPIKRLEKREPVLKEEESPFTNRIHADDLALICHTAMHHENPGRIYNAVDSAPSTMTAYFNAIADYAGLPRPPQISLQEAGNVLSDGMLSYQAESRRISNKKLLRELNIQLQYPSLAEAVREWISNDA